MKTIKSMSQLCFLSFSIAASILFTTVQAAEVSICGTTYEITTREGDPKAMVHELKKTPWYGSKAVAVAFTSALKKGAGMPNKGGKKAGMVGPYFLYDHEADGDTLTTNVTFYRKHSKNEGEYKTAVKTQTAKVGKRIYAEAEKIACASFACLAPQYVSCPCHFCESVAQIDPDSLPKDLTLLTLEQTGTIEGCNLIERDQGLTYTVTDDGTDASCNWGHGDVGQKLVTHVLSQEEAKACYREMEAAAEKLAALGVEVKMMPGQSEIRCPEQP